MLELMNLSAGYDRQDTIRDISLSFQPGTLYTIVGRNGCGKSTLLKVCAGLLPAHSGSVLLDGRELSSYAPMERACRISYLSQSRNTPGISVERLVEHGRYPRLSSPRRLNHEDRQAIENTLERMQLEPLRRKNLHDLSGGERQRVYIAMLLAQDAPVLLLDEPTTYMDIEHQLSLLELLRDLKMEGKIIIMVLHDLQQAMKISDEVIVMEDGRIAAASAPADILSNSILERVFRVRIEIIGDAGSCVLNMEKPR